MFTLAMKPIASYAIPRENPKPHVNWALDPSRAALLVHDMQNYFIAAYTRDEDPIATAIPNIAELIRLFDAAGAPVFYSVQPPAQTPARRGLLTDMWGEGMSSEEDAAIIPELTPRKQHHVLTKWRYSAFERTDLRQALAYLHRDQLVITGVYGHMGCQVSATDAFMNDIQPFLATDAIADFSSADHASAVNWVGTRAGVSSPTALLAAAMTTPEEAHA